MNPDSGTRHTLILLSSYNGARFLEQQLESIRDQSHSEWTLLIRDDGSSDETLSIIERFSQLDARIALLRDDRGNLGPWASFGRLLEASASKRNSYIFLSDQDDFWLPDKLERQFALILAEEQRSGRNHPILVHSDLEVVDDRLRTIHPSFLDFQRTWYDKADPLGTLLIHNAVVGCTIGINRALLAFASPLPPGSPHDWWLAVSAAAIGTILKTPKQTVLYRQHGENAIGAQPRHALLGSLLRSPFTFVTKAMREFGVGVGQASDLYERLVERGLGNTEAAKRVERYNNAFRSRSSLVARLKSLRDSRARPRRRLSRVAILGLIAAFPHVRTGSE